MASTGTDTLNARASWPDTEDTGLVASVVRRTAGHVAATADRDRKAIAQVFTPASAARFMAARASWIGEEFTFIDAGTGVGVADRRDVGADAGLPKPRRVTAELYEIDPNVLPVLSRTSDPASRCWRSRV